LSGLEDLSGFEGLLTDDAGDKRLNACVFEVQASLIQRRLRLLNSSLCRLRLGSRNNHLLRRCLCALRLSLGLLQLGLRLRYFSLCGRGLMLNLQDNGLCGIHRSARRIRRIASTRFSPQTISLAIIGS